MIDRDPLDIELVAYCEVELIAPHRYNRQTGTQYARLPVIM
jgi:hypothetical protein